MGDCAGVDSDDDSELFIREVVFFRSKSALPFVGEKILDCWFLLLSFWGDFLLLFEEAEEMDMSDGDGFLPRSFSSRLHLARLLENHTWILVSGKRIFFDNCSREYASG